MSGLLRELNDLEVRLDKALFNRRVARDINRELDERATLGQRVADHFARVVGSWTFIITQSVLLAAWITLNVVAWISQWDPYPFILLNLMLSFQAAYTGPILLMSANRQTTRDRLAAEHDYEVNVKAEALIEQIHHRLNELLDTNWLEHRTCQQEELELLRGIAARLDVTP